MVMEKQQALLAAENQYDENQQVLHQCTDQLDEKRSQFQHTVDALTENLYQIQKGNDESPFPMATIEELRQEGQAIIQRAEEKIDEAAHRNQEAFLNKQEVLRQAIKDEIRQEEPS